MIVLAKLKGCLVRAEVAPSEQGGSGKCPVCQGTEFIDRDGWIECDGCYDYAVLKSDYERFAEAMAVPPTPECCPG